MNNPELSKAQTVLERLEFDLQKRQKKEDETVRAEEIRKQIQTGEETENLEQYEDNPYVGGDDCCTIL